MRNKIIWADEDERVSGYERRLLMGLGYQIEALPDATVALEYISSITGDDVILAIIDIMLLQGANSDIFSNERTSEGNNCGLVLAEDAFEIAPWLQGKTIFYSRASKAAHVAMIKKKAASLGIKFCPKGPSSQGLKFVQWLVDNNLLPPVTKG